MYRAFEADWLKKDPLVFVLGFLGWTVPSTVGVSAFGGNSLFGLLMGSIGENMVCMSEPFLSAPLSPTGKTKTLRVLL